MTKQAPDSPTTPKALSVGDKVRWSSQAQGYRTEKVGVVAAVVAAGQRPDRNKFPKLYKGAGAGYSRDHESYVVMVGNKPYWPRVAGLNAADPKACERCAALEQRVADLQARLDRALKERDDARAIVRQLRHERRQRDGGGG